MATHASTGLRRHAGVPSPVGAAWPLIGLAAVALLLEAAPDLPWEVGVGVALLFAAAASVRLVQEHLAVRRLRSLADRIILRSRDHPTASALIAWRTSELTCERHRHALASQATRLAHELDAGVLPGAVPLNRVAVRPYRPQLEQLAEILRSPRPVSAHGVLVAEELLSSAASPLYDRSQADRLGRVLRHAITTLETAR